MNADTLVLRGLLDYKNFVQYAGTISKLDDLDKPFKVILKLVGDYFETYGADGYIRPPHLLAHFHRRYPSPDGMDLVITVLEGMVGLDITEPEILRAAMARFAEKYFLNQILLASVPVLEDQTETCIEEVKNIIANLEQVTDDLDAEGEGFEPLRIADVLEYTEAEGLSWALNFLQEALGPVRGAHLYHFFARPDSGKTSLCCHLAANFAWQLRDTPGECILYLNNEEHIRRVNRRLMCALLDKSPDQLGADEEALQEEWLRKGGTRIVTKGDVQSVVEVEKYISIYRPRVVFIDVGPKVQPMGINSDTSGPDKKHLTYTRFRELANQYDCAIITTGQADSSADGKMFISMNQMDGSKVGIPSELDAAIGIGVGSADMVRFFFVSKNKILGTYLKSPPHIINPITSRITEQ